MSEKISKSVVETLSKSDEPTKEDGAQISSPDGTNFKQMDESKLYPKLPPSKEDPESSHPYPLPEKVAVTTVGTTLKNNIIINPKQKMKEKKMVLSKRLQSVKGGDTPRVEQIDNVQETNDCPVEENILVEANVVDVVNVVDAEAVKGSPSSQKLFSLLKGIGAILLGGGVIVGVVFGLVLNDEDSGGAFSPENFTLSAVPSISPSLAPTMEMGPQESTDRLKSLLPEFSIRAIESNQRSPQALAAQWITLDENFANYHDWQILQRYAMAVIYHASGGSDWTNNTGWLQDSDECSWYDERHPSTGEICVNGTRRVLNLEGNNLVGSLPPEIGMLSNLGALNLAGNELVGPLPSEIGFLTALRAFIVYNNKWTGTIPTSVGLMTELRVFDIDNAALDGE